MRRKSAGPNSTGKRWRPSGNASQCCLTAVSNGASGIVPARNCHWMRRRPDAKRAAPWSLASKYHRRKRVTAFSATPS
eukprot:5882289-Prymnesium_polylepis.1